MSDSFVPGNEPSSIRPRFQFDLRTMLLLTALVAWGLGWTGGQHAWSVVALGGLALIEAGCYPNREVLSLLVRNLLALFVCSLLVGMFGIGLMTGSNPTGFVGIDHFFQFPFGHEVDLRAIDDPDDYRQMMLGYIPASFAYCLAAVHWVLAGRVRWPAYLLVWLVAGGFLFPVLGSWTWEHPPDGAGGWLARLGYSDFSSFGTRLAATGWMVLAGTLVLGPGRRRGGHRLSLFSATCNRRLVSLGALTLLLLNGPISILYGLILYGESSGLDHILWQAAPMVTGLLGAAVACRIVPRGCRLPLVLCGGLGGQMTIWSAFFLQNWPTQAFVGLVAGGLVVLASWFFDRLGIDDPGAALSTYAVCALWGMTARATLPRVAETLGIPDLVSFDSFLGQEMPLVSLLAAAACFIWIFLPSVGLFLLIRKAFPAQAEPLIAEEVVILDVVPETDLNQDSQT